MKKYMSKLLIVVSILAFILNMNCSALHQNIGSIERLNYAFATSDEIESQVKALHKDIINSNGGKTLEGWCAQYVSWSLYHQGITTNFEAKGNANQVYGNWKDKSITSGGYEVIKYPGEDGLAQLIEENGNEMEGSPFKFYVIGDPDQLEASLLTEGSHINRLIIRKLNITIEKFDEIILPEAKKSIEPKFMERADN